MTITHNINIDLVRPAILPPVNVVQGEENSRAVAVELYADGVPWAPPDGHDVEIRYRKSDGTAGVYTDLPDGTPAWASEGNTVSVILAPQMLTCPGKVPTQVRICVGDSVISTFTFIVDVEADPSRGASASEDYVKLHYLPQATAGAQIGQLLQVSGLDNKGNVESLIAVDPVAHYGNTPFYVMDLPQTETQVRYNADGTTEALEGCSPIVKCPKYLGWNMGSGESRLQIYIGDYVDGVFTPDERYLLYTTTTTGLKNYLNPSYNRIIETDGTKYFWYKKVEQGDPITIVGADAIPTDCLDAAGCTPFFGASSGVIGLKEAYYSIVLPVGAFYAVLLPQEYWASNTGASITYEYPDGTVVYNSGASFGYVPEDVTAALLRLPQSLSPDAVRVYTSKAVMSRPSGRGEIARQMCRDLVTKVRWMAQVGLPWSSSAHSYNAGTIYHGVPYSSRWRNSHYVGYEVSMETMLNALNDPYSVAYDTTEARKEINSKGGLGYGLVCSALVSVALGCPYPQSNRGFTFDRSFELAGVSGIQSGQALVNAPLGHCALVDEILDDGYTLYEAVSPNIAKTVHTSVSRSPKLGDKVSKRYLDNFPHTVTYRGALSDNRGLLNFDVAVANGSIRPWRGNRAVYGPWDKSASGSGIGITIHDNAATAYLVQPSGNVVSLDVAGLTYLDIADHVTEDGTYELYSNVSDVREYFRYYNHADATMSFDAEGRACFDADDVAYAYAYVYGYGGDFGDADTQDYGPVVIARGQRYPDIAKDLSKIRTVYACIIADPTPDDCWGKYSAVCALGDSAYKPTGNGVGITSVKIEEV